MMMLAMTIVVARGFVPVDDVEVPVDVSVDSLHLAIIAHNKAVDDSIREDSINRARKNGIDAPVTYVAKDSMVYDATTKTAYLFGSSNVKYENMDLTAAKINMSLDSSIVRATGAMDTAKNQREGLPVFMMGNDKYETDTMAFNFKSKRGLIQNAYTHQDDGYLLSDLSKRDSAGNFYIKHGRYTTCDDPHPDFYIALSRAKVRPGKDVVFGPAYLVVQDVPLPLAIPYGFFPFTKSYSSGVIMPTYGDEMNRGFYLRDGGYYFALSDKMDLKLLGEIFTKGSWGLSAASNYNVRYKYSGQLYASYQDSRTGDADIDETRTTSFKIQWSHRQDSKANPYSTFSAAVNFTTTNYEQNNLTSMYNPITLTQSTRTSSVSWSTMFSSIGMTLSGSTNITQNMRDSSIAVTLPDLNIGIAQFYPFKRKHLVGKQKWYEKIFLSYTGRLQNSITTKENQLLHSNLIKDWKNGWQHTIPVKATFQIAKYLNLVPSVTFTDRMYSTKVMRSWDETNQTELADTLHGFYNVYNWSMALSMNTKLYGFFVPNRKIFGDKIQAIRHTLTPSMSFSYAPDFGASSYGYWESYQRTDAQGNVTNTSYSPYSGQLYGVPGKGKTGRVSMTLDNNIEMKIRSDKDSTGIRKISIIDRLAATMSYNMAAKERPWSDLVVDLRLKWWKNYTFTMNAVFATYAYDLDDNGKPYVGTHTEYSRGRFGRFQGLSQNIHYTLTPEKLRKLFGGGRKKDDNENKNEKDADTGTESNVDPVMMAAQNGAEKKNAGLAQTDDDGYLKFSMPWSVTFSYGITMRENTGGSFDYDRMRYPYKFTQNLNVSGNLRLSDGWNITFTSGYDFDFHKLSLTTASLARDLHCFSMSCYVVLAPYTSYNFSFRCNASTLTDALKYDKRSSYSNSIKWY
ncbi:MAG: LPS-assembly protein LptD [Prevotella sp.]|nr:LPS-assembly protein LptD [Prevotella sp.]MBR1839386.1 LPS-assembly protein LptD [Prevotella sp.]